MSFQFPARGSSFQIAYPLSIVLNNLPIEPVPLTSFALSQDQRTLSPISILIGILIDVVLSFLLTIAYAKDVPEPGSIGFKIGYVFSRLATGTIQTLQK